MSPVTADRWNLLIPVGYHVCYWPGPITGEGVVSATRSPAWTVLSGAPVVSVEGYAGGIHLDHVMPLVPVSRLYVQCAYPTRPPYDYGPRAMSDCCRAPASWAVTDRDGGYWFRCEDHKALLSDGGRGRPRLRVPRPFGKLPVDDRSAARMLGTETYFDAMRKALDDAAAGADGMKVSFDPSGQSWQEAKARAAVAEQVAASPEWQEAIGMPAQDQEQPGPYITVVSMGPGISPPEPSPTRVLVRDESHLLRQPGTPGWELMRKLWGESRVVTARDDDSDDVRMLLDAARDAGRDHHDYLGLVRAAEILRHGPNHPTTGGEATP